MLPSWSSEIISLYQSNAANQFILYGNVNDQLALGLGDAGSLGTLQDFFLKVLMPRFDVVLSYDLGNGIRIEKGGEIFSSWPAMKDSPDLPKAPRPAIETMTRYFRYCSNLANLGKLSPQIGFIVKSAHLVAPSAPGSVNYDLNALALLMRDWSIDPQLSTSRLATCLVCENLNDLHPLLTQNSRATAIKIPLPSSEDLALALSITGKNYPQALAQFKKNLPSLAAQLAGASLTSVEHRLKLKEYQKEALTPADLVALKKELVEKDCEGLIEFLKPSKTLDDLHGQETLKEWLRQDIALWRQGDLQALPMGYLICGPVGTGKTYLVECLAGEAEVPVVKIKNFRDKWVGSTEGNLEKIFRLIQALGRCFVFIDEADQALGKRDSGSNDSGLSGRIYSMIAKEMSNGDNRGRIIWVLASSRPDLIEVDLKRPGRIDVKIPIFPTATPEESFHLIHALCKRRKLDLPADTYSQLHPKPPILLTPGAAEALSVKIYRATKTRSISALEALKESLTDYQNPISKEILDFQIGLAIQETTDIGFVPPLFRKTNQVAGTPNNSVQVTGQI